MEAAIDKVYPALVRIYVVMEEGSEGRMKKMQGSGSGTIISPDGYVLTNHHVAGRGTRFVCTLPDHEEVDADLVGTDALADLAVLKLDLSTRRLKGRPLAVAAFGDSDALKIGDTVFAMGSPAGLSQSVTRGIVSNTEMIVPRSKISFTLDGEKVGELVRWIGHDAVIYPGNSGGPLVNTAGEIVGINEVGIASLGGAIPSDLARKVAEELIAKGSVTRSWIGLEAQSLLRSMADKKGALVSTVWKDSPADKAGIQPGDFITSFNGTPLPDCHADEDLPVFNAMVLETPPGTKVTLTGERGGKPRTWNLTTIPREPNLDRENEIREWGVTLRDFTKVSALEKFRENEDGVIVDSVRVGSPAAQAKPALAADDVIVRVGGSPIHHRKDLEKITTDVMASGEEKHLLTEFERGTQLLATVVTIGPEKDPVRPRLAEKAWLGASTQVLTDDLSEAMEIAGKKGVRVTSVTPESPADKAGIEKGDLLLKLDGKVIGTHRPEDSEVFSERIRAYAVDAKIRLEGLRSGQPRTWEVSLAPRPIDDSELDEFKDEVLEFTARELSSAQQDQAREQFGEASPAGVAVSKVEPSGWASLGGLLASDIILRIDGSEMKTLEDLRSRLLAFRKSRPSHIVLEVRRDARTQFLEISPRW